MAGTSTANWRAAMANATVEPVHTVTIQTPTTTYNAASNPTLDLGYDAALVDVAGFGKRFDPVTRKTSIDQVEITLLDAWARQLVVAERIKGAKITIKTGASGLAGVDYRTRFIGLVDSFQPREERGGVVLRCVDALTYAIERDIKLRWINDHPLIMIYEAMTAAGVPTSLINSSSFNPANYTTTISHWVVDEARIDRTTEHGVYMRHYTDNYGIEGVVKEPATDPARAISRIESLQSILPGVLVVGDDGVIAFVEYDDSAAAEVHFTTSEYSDFEFVGQYENQANEITIPIGSNGREMEHKAEDAASKTAFAYPGESERVISRDLTDAWFGGWCHIIEDIPNGTATTCELSSGRLFGLCGTKVLTGWPSTAQPAYAPLSAARPAYWLMRDPVNGDEIVKVTAATVNDDHRAGIIVANGDIYTTTPQMVPQSLSVTTMVRAQMGTTGVKHEVATISSENEGNLFDMTEIFDLTIPIALADYHLKRFSYGCPVIRFKASSFGADIYGIGDIITIDSDEFVSYGLDGLSSTSKFEIIGKEFDPFDDQPGPRFMCALVRTDAVTVDTTTLTPGFSLDSLRHMFDAARAVDIFKPFIGRGLNIADGGGLVITLPFGMSGNGFNRAINKSAQSLTLRASRDSYLSMDTLTGAVVIRDVATGAGDPGVNSYEAALGWSAAGAATLTSVTIGRDTEYMHGTRVVDRSILHDKIDTPLARAYVTGVQLLPKGSTWTTLVISAEESDTGGDYNTGTYTYTAPVDGYYDIRGQVRADTVEAGKLIATRLRKNGSTTIGFSGETRNDSAGSVSLAAECSAANVYLAATNTVVMQGWSDNAASSTMTQGAGFSAFEIRRVR